MSWRVTPSQAKTLPVELFILVLYFYWNIIFINSYIFMIKSLPVFRLKNCILLNLLRMIFLQRFCMCVCIVVFSLIAWHVNSRSPLASHYLCFLLILKIKNVQENVVLLMSLKYGMRLWKRKTIDDKCKDKTFSFNKWIITVVSEIEPGELRELLPNS